ncbi:MAG: hypothetical protein ACYCZC_07870 [Acidithiobacillus sp.]
MAKNGKTKPRKTKNPGWWWIGIAIIAIGTLVIWATLRMPIHEIAPQSEVHPPVTVAPSMAAHRLDLGSYGVTIPGSAGRNRFLTIHPVVEIQGKRNWSGLRTVRPAMEAAIENPFMAFPDLARLPDSLGARDQLRPSSCRVSRR